MPTQPRICLLAAWLGVRPEWLRYADGIAASPKLDRDSFAVPRELFLIVKDYSRLDADSKQIFDATLALMLAIQSTTSAGNTEQE